MQGSQGSWPAVGHETVRWERSEPSFGSRRKVLEARGDYQAVIPALIATAPLSLPAALIGELEDAVSTLVRFDAQVGSLTAPFSSILLRTESASSSEIEKLTASAKAIALAELGQSDSLNAQLIVDNVAAMEAALSLKQQISAENIIAMHACLMTRTWPEICGRFRNQPVWVGGHSPQVAHFVPPVSSRVPELINDLVLFTKRLDVPALAQIAIAHAQFETIHPFEDGNGRTGRAIVQSMLGFSSLKLQTTVPISAGLLHDTDSYFAALDSYRAGDPIPIINSFLDASFKAVALGTDLAERIQKLASDWQEQVNPRANSTAAKLINLLLAQPAIDVKSTSSQLGVSEEAARTALVSLVEAGVVSESSGGKRNRVFVATRVLEALDEFAASARRRSF
jgi:Fic family protein